MSQYCRRVLMMLLPLIGVSSAEAKVPVLAVAGLKTYAPGEAGCPWVGVAVAEAFCARLSDANSAAGLQQAERVDLAEILRRSGMDFAAEDGALADNPRQASAQLTGAICRLVHDKLPELAKREQTTIETSSVESAAVAVMTPYSGRLYGASHLVLGCVLL